MVATKIMLNPQANISWSYDGWHKAPAIAKLTGGFGMKINVGIVEDDRELRESLAKVVEGHSRLRCVAACKSGEEAIQLLPPLTPDVVLMDINLPGMTGLKCTALLKDRLPKTQILML